MNLPGGYFDRPDTPAQGSPVGKLMEKILAEFPEMPVEQARQEANSALQGLGGPGRLAAAWRRWLASKARVKTRQMASPSRGERVRRGAEFHGAVQAEAL